MYPTLKSTCCKLLNNMTFLSYFMKIIRSNILLFSISLLSFLGCTEPFTIVDTIDLDYENLLVVECSLTNEVKRQEVKLSRTIGLDEFGQPFENDATVNIENTEGVSFHFSQNEETGIYLSDEVFSAIENTSYTLKIATKNGEEYTSTPMRIGKPVAIDAVYPELDQEYDFEGVTVYVDAHDDSNTAKYFRYEYEETYKIRVPNPSNYNWEFTNFGIEDAGYYEVDLTWKTPKTICYSPTFKSKGIMQFSTKNLDESNVVHFPIRFIWEESPMLRESYSILVKQYVQSVEAYTFYKVIEDLGQSESKLSQSQSGYISGNISSITNPDKKVVGFFEVASVTSKRIYFNYFDLDYEFPPYFFECEYLFYLPTKELKSKIETENYQIVDWTEDGPIKGYYIYKETCADCTTFASKKKPEFWED